MKKSVCFSFIFVLYIFASDRGKKKQKQIQIIFSNAFDLNLYDSIHQYVKNKIMFVIGKSDYALKSKYSVFC